MRTTALGALALATIALPSVSALDLEGGVQSTAEAGAPAAVESVSNSAVTRVPTATSEAQVVALNSGSSITGEVPGSEVPVSEGVVVEIPPEFVAPIENSSVSSGFEVRTHPVLGYEKKHEGEDWKGVCGTPVHAVTDGTVTRAFRHDVSGNRVELDHGDGLSTWYGHLEGFAVGVGDTVQAGELVGYVGTTGRSTGCHLHLAVSVDGSYVDPVDTIWNASWAGSFRD